MNKRQELIKEAETYDKSWNSLGEPYGAQNRYRDELIDHLEELSDEEIEAIDSLDEYDYKS